MFFDDMLPHAHILNLSVVIKPDITNEDLLPSKRNLWRISHYCHYRQDSRLWCKQTLQETVSLSVISIFNFSARKNEDFVFIIVQIIK